MNCFYGKENTKNNIHVYKIYSTIEKEELRRISDEMGQLNQKPTSMQWDKKRRELESHSPESVMCIENILTKKDTQSTSQHNGNILCVICISVLLIFFSILIN